MITMNVIRKGESLGGSGAGGSLESAMAACKESNERKAKTKNGTRQPDRVSPVLEFGFWFKRTSILSDCVC